MSRDALQQVCWENICPQVSILAFDERLRPTYFTLPAYSTILLAGLKKYQRNSRPDLELCGVEACLCRLHVALTSQAAFERDNQNLRRTTDYIDFSDTLTIKLWIQDVVRCW